MVLPEGFALPPVPYLLGLVAAVTLVAGALYRTGPSVTDRTVVALAPWVAVGSALHVLYVVEWVPGAVRPLLGTPAVYLTTFAVAGAVWLAAPSTPVSAERALAATGTAVALVVVGYALARGIRAGELAVFWPAVALAVAVGVTVALWIGTRRTYPDAAAATGAAGVLALFGHALDAVSTAVGVDVLGFGERTPVSQIVLDAAAGLPTADVIGVGWLFVLVKLVIAEAVVVLFAELVREDPREGYLLLGAVGAVGLGPGAHNLLLFVVAG
ncbi:DUF63 family protein [Halorussus marinus]|uniref:DUF63 family protein n=1 Tax=Halorussus marinus TaxID=2505976 RepID=UPI00106E1E75|nr:DUF63 family protein [Halorussus marinus]